MTTTVTLRLKPRALSIMFRSAKEVFRRIGNIAGTRGETVGNLYGNNYRNGANITILVDYAQPFQLTEERKPSKVITYAEACESMDWTMKWEKVVGDYHSHIWYSPNNGSEGNVNADKRKLKTPPKLSISDRENLEECPFTGEEQGLVSVILALNKSTRITLPSVTDKKISGIVKVVNDNKNELYHVAIQAYYLDKPNPDCKGYVKRANLKVSDSVLKRMFLT